MAAEPYDEDDIDPEDFVIRRVNPDQHVVQDDNTGRLRTSSKLFTPSSGTNGGMSVDILKLIEEANLNPQEYVTTPVFTGSVCFSAQDARALGLRVGYDPLEENPYHGEVWGPADRPQRFTKGEKRALARASEWFVEIPDVDIKA